MAIVSYLLSYLRPLRSSLFLFFFSLFFTSLGDVTHRTQVAQAGEKFPRGVIVRQELGSRDSETRENTFVSIARVTIDKKRFHRVYQTRTSLRKSVPRNNTALLIRDCACHSGIARGGGRGGRRDDVRPENFVESKFS